MNALVQTQPNLVHHLHPEDSLSDTPNRASAPGDRHQVVVHVWAEALSQNVSAETFSGNVPAETPLHPETVRPLACYGGLRCVTDVKLDPVVVCEFSGSIRSKGGSENIVQKRKSLDFRGCSEVRVALR